jgi:sialic acid synthase SpsE
MSWRESNSLQLSALAVAEVHFPDQARKVQHLFHVSEAFRSMCEDLSVVVETLTHLDDLPHGEREMRRQEYKGLAEALVGEIGEALSHSNVVSIRRSAETKPGSW